MFGSKSRSTKALEGEISDLGRRHAQLQNLHDQSIRDLENAEAALAEFLDKGDLSGGLDGAQSDVHRAKQNAIDLSAALERFEPGPR